MNRRRVDCRDVAERVHELLDGEPLPVMPVACGVFRSVSEGARKPLPTAERNIRFAKGCQRSEAFGLTVWPTPS